MQVSDATVTDSEFGSSIWQCCRSHSRKTLALVVFVCAPAFSAGTDTLSPPSDVTIHSPSHTVVVVLENRSASEVYGQGFSFPDAPFLRSLADRGAVMTRASFAQTPYGRTPSGYLGPLPSRPSQPNYLYLFAGNNQGVLPEYFVQPSMPVWYPYKGTASNDANGDLFPFTQRDIQVGIGNRRVPEQMLPFSTPNLGASIIAKGGSFAGFFESLPYPTFQDETFDDGEGLYKRKHDPVINWVDLHDTSKLVTTQNALPLAAHLGFKSTTDPQMHRRFRGFVEDADGKPMGFDQLPTVSLVVPNQAHDGHDASLAKADEWLKKNIGPYAQWALAHDGLLVITFDEDGATRNVPGGAKRAGIDNIPTLFYGPMVKPGRYDELVDHLNLLATILQLHGDLERFRTQFAAAYRSVEAEHEFANLRPILDIFGGGIALQAFSQPR